MCVTILILITLKVTRTLVIKKEESFLSLVFIPI